MKQDILEEVSIFLLRKGYTLKSFTRTCFDILARLDERILLIKIIENANSLSHSVIEEMKVISSYLQASPVIISDKAHFSLENNVVYTRHGVYTLNFTSFKSAIDNRYPFLQSNQAGITANINPLKFKQARELQGYSLNSLARKIGLSRKTIEKYETKNSQLTLTNAVKVFNVLGNAIFEKVDLFNANIFGKDSGVIGYNAHSHSMDNSHRDIHNKNTSASEISKKYSALGFKAAETHKAPFDVVAKLDKEIILTELGDKQAEQLRSISRIVGADNLIIYDKKNPAFFREEINEDIPIIKKDEFLEFEKAKELIRFLRVFK